MPQNLSSPNQFWDDQVARGQTIVRFIEDAGVNPHGRVLEIGCGAGGIHKIFNDKGCDVAGCDFGEPFLEYGRQQGLYLEYGDQTSLGKYAPADLIILSHIIEHFLDPVSELLKIRSLLKASGYVYVEVPGFFWIQNTYKSDIGTYLQNAHVYHFCSASLDYVMSLAGFVRVSGNEQITALYRPADVAPIYPHNLPTKIIRHLRKSERVRPFLKARTTVRKVLGPVYRKYVKPLFYGDLSASQ